jgi:hypothetical protein
MLHQGSLTKTLSQFMIHQRQGEMKVGHCMSFWIYAFEVMPMSLMFLVAKNLGPSILDSWA